MTSLLFLGSYHYGDGSVEPKKDRRKEMQVFQVNFIFNGTRSDVEKAFVPLAQTIAEQPGLKWKIWCWNDENRECAGQYLFEDAGSLKAYLDGPIIAQVKKHPAISKLSAKVFTVMEEPTAVTRGPVQGVLTGRK
jgi:hypothetical protein